MWTQPVIFTFCIHVGSSDVFSVKKLAQRAAENSIFLTCYLNGEFHSQCGKIEDLMKLGSMRPFLFSYTFCSILESGEN